MSLSKVMKLANTYATPTGHLNFHFAPLALSYDLQCLRKLQTFSTVKQKNFFIDQTQQYTPVLF